MTTTSQNDDSAAELEPLDALAAMLEIEQNMIEATRKLIELNQRLPSTSAKAQPAIRAKLEELMAIIVAYQEQIEFLRRRYLAGR